MKISKRELAQIKSDQDIGRFGERAAVNFLKKKGYKIIAVNYRNKFGEIDIIGSKGGVLIFFEVKTSRESEGFYPEERVDWKKKKQLTKMAWLYLSDNSLSNDIEYQIDIIAVRILNNGEIEIEQIENAVGG